MNIKIFQSLLFCLCCSSLIAQISFTNHSELLENQGLISGFSMGVSDMNGDGLDDIIRFNLSQDCELEIQEGNGFSTRSLGVLINDDIWSVAVGDLDKNGYNDLIVGGFYENPALIETLDKDNYNMELVTGGPLIFMQGSNFADINNDGLLDYFACNDDGLSPAYRGVGDGELEFDQELINTTTTDPTETSGNYASTFIDYDNDGDLDLYISKCRLGISDPEDGRRLNQMFRNNNDGTYTEVAPMIGLQPKGQSWSTEFGDIDNDGDLDAMILNHDIESKLYENDGAGNFTDISVAAGIELNLSNFPQAMQLYMYDFDNDGFLDIFATSYTTFPKLFHNNGDKTFTEVVTPWGTDINTTTNNNLQSAAIGDLNNDGFLDMIAGFANGINIPNGSQPDRLYLNETNANNWIKITLKGTECNANGIGAKIKIKGAWGTQMREVRSGHSYGIMNTLNTHFGIGNATEIESLEVTWPSGFVSLMTDVPINGSISITESNLITENATQYICEGDSIFLGGAFQTMEGSYTDSIGVDTILITDLFLNDAYDITATPVNTCYGAEATFGDETLSEPGTYTFDYTTAEGCDSSVTVTFNWEEEILVEGEITDDWGPGSGAITITVDGATNPYQVFWSTGDTDVLTITDLDHGETYQVEILDANGCTQLSEFTVGLSSLQELNENGINVFPNPFSSLISINNNLGIATKGEMYDVLGKRIKSFKVKAGKQNIDASELITGVYFLRLLDENQKPLGSMQIIKD